MTPDSTPGLGATEAEANRRIRTLFVEDDRSLAEMLVDFIQELGFQTTLTDQASKAISILRKSKNEGQPIELVVSDLGLRDGSGAGLRIADAIRDEELAAYFILFSGNSSITPDLTEEHGISALVSKHDGLPALESALTEGRRVITGTPSQSA